MIGQISAFCRQVVGGPEPRPVVSGWAFTLHVWYGQCTRCFFKCSATKGLTQLLRKSCPRGERREIILSASWTIQHEEPRTCFCVELDLVSGLLLLY